MEGGNWNKDPYCIFMTAGNWSKVPRSSPWDWERDSESPLPECLHFKETVLQVLEETVLGDRFTSEKTEKDLKLQDLDF